MIHAYLIFASKIFLMLVITLTCGMGMYVGLSQILMVIARSMYGHQVSKSIVISYEMGDVELEILFRMSSLCPNLDQVCFSCCTVSKYLGDIEL